MERFEGKNVLVTGASSGIGRATVRAFVDEGAWVFAVGRDEGRLDEVRENCSHPKKVLTSIADVGDPEQARRMVREAVAEYGTLDVVVNDAGIAFTESVLDSPDEHWHETIAANLSGPYFASQEAARHMAQHGGGVIVNVASTDAFAAESPQVAYNVSKAGVVMLTKSLAHELGHLGIRVNAVAPGETLTPMLGDDMDQPGFRDVYLSQIPMRRAAQPEEQAAVILFLASDEASFVNGTTVVADGGQLAGTWYDPREAPPVP